MPNFELHEGLIWMQIPRPRLTNVQCGGCNVQVLRDEVRLVIHVRRENHQHPKANYFHGNAACLINGCDSRPNLRPTVLEVERMVIEGAVGCNPPNNDFVER